MERKPYIEFMGLKLDMKTREKAQFERKYGSPMKEIFKLISMMEIMEATQNGGDLSSVDFNNFDMMSLDFMANLIHASSQRLNSGTTLDVVYDLLDIYLEQQTVFDLMGVCVELLVNVGYLNFGEEE